MMTSGGATCSALSGLTSPSLSCSFVIDPIPTNRDTLIIQGAFTASLNGGFPFSIQVNSVRNMPTTRPYSNFEI